MQYKYTLSARSTGWLKLARILLEHQETFLVLHLNEANLEACNDLARQFSYRIFTGQNASPEAQTNTHPSPQLQT